MSTKVPAQLITPTTALTLTDQATIATNAALGNTGDVTLTASRTMGAPTNPTDQQRFVWRIKQGGSGSYTITWNAVFDWGVVGAPTLSTSVGKIDLCGGIYNATAAKWQMVTPALGFG